MVPMMKRLLFLLAAFSLQAQPSTLELDLGSGVKMEMILVQPGSFMQGSPSDEPGREVDEAPQRKIQISRAFYLGKHPVTYSQFARFVEATRYRTEAEKGSSGGYGVVNGKLAQQKSFSWRNPGFPQGPDHPVTIVSASDAEAFCRWLSSLTRRTCTLPTEAQWEYACRAGTTTAHYSSAPVDQQAWHRGNSDAQTHPVGEKLPNAWGFHDFYGPVWQWCRDWYAPYVPSGDTSDPLQKDPNLSDKPRRVLRGGSFISDVSHSRSAERYRNDQGSRNADNGFRIICSEEVKTAAAPAPVSTPGASSSTSNHVSPQPTTTHRVVAQQGTRSSLFGNIFFFGLAVWVISKIIKTVKSFQGGGSALATGLGTLTGMQAADMLTQPAQPLSHRFGFNLTDDGFYISGPDEASGTLLHYECLVGDRTLADDVTFTPGPQGHFVFTGKRPSRVSIQTTGGAAGTDSSVLSSSDDDDTPFSRHSFRSSSQDSRYPSAY